MASLVSLGMSHGWLWTLGAKMMRPFLNRFAHDGTIINIPVGVQDWFRCRDLQAMPAKTFHETWDDLQSDSVPSEKTKHTEDS